MLRRGDFYPGAGRSAIGRTTPGMEDEEPFSFGARFREGQPDGVGARITPSLSSGGVQLGQFTFGELTIGLLVIGGFIWFMDRKVL